MFEINTRETGLSVLMDHSGKLARALGLMPREPVFCLLRPDLHLAARIEQPNAAKVGAALRRALKGKT